MQAPNAEKTDQFGRSVAIDGDRAIVGTHQDDGPQDYTESAGAAYLFERSNGTWNQIQILRPSDPTPGANFGRSVSIDGDYILIGAPSKDIYTGAVYVFKRTDDGWPTHEHKILRASNAENGSKFGGAIAMDGPHAIIGAYSDNGPSNNTAWAGAAYIFEHSDDGWPSHETHVLRASNADRFDTFGRSVAIDDSFAVVGAHREDGPANQTNWAGAVYLFERTDDGWPAHETHIFRASNAEEADNFGYSVAIDVPHVIAGARDEAGPANANAFAGAAYAFEHTDGGWPATESTVLRASNASPGDNLGYAVALDGERAIVGATFEDGPSNSTHNVGAAYVFQHTDRGWTSPESRILRAPDRDAGDHFGKSVAIEDNRVVVTAPISEESVANLKKGSAAYVYNDLFSPPTVQLNAVTSRTASTTQFTGLVHPGGGVTSLQFEYRKTGTATFQRVPVNRKPLTGTETDTTRGRIFALAGSTEYEVRLVAANSAGTDTSALAVVQTPSPDPIRRPTAGPRTDPSAGLSFFFSLAGSSSPSFSDVDLIHPLLSLFPDTTTRDLARPRAPLSATPPYATASTVGPASVEARRSPNVQDASPAKGH